MLEKGILSRQNNNTLRKENDSTPGNDNFAHNILVDLIYIQRGVTLNTIGFLDISKLLICKVMA